ncbi:G-protein coupled receptor family C group 6 member A-like [Parambassis ranga]|uniref:G-protein coupled receptor family C group 6 member A-like n=1 Tax=Parambassis ranga TaxID=210632 RepID=A0A6P7HCT2_9TELE|nr:G-protein coupled receptor family C group 6 member A-like [Parambassis ranga]
MSGSTDASTHLCSSTMFLLWIFVCIISHSSSDNDTRLHAFSPGDIMIGGLFPIHIKTNRSENPGPLSCSDYDVQMFLRSQVMVHAIREINQRAPRLLPNFTIGYDMYDTCADVSLAIRATLQMLKNQSDPQSCSLSENIQLSLPEPQIKALVGERHSEVSIAVARIVALSSVPQISYSSSVLLSTKSKFPTFLRIVSSDQFQTLGMAALVKDFKWASVAIIGSDDEYGKYGSDNLEEIFKSESICIEFVEILPGTFHQNDASTKEKVNKLIKLINESEAEAIIMFTKETNVEIILEAAIKHKLNRTWIASDTWSTHSMISTMTNISLAGQVFGFIFKKNEVPGFEDYVLSMFNGTTNDIVKYHLTQYPLCSNGANEKNKSDPCTDPSTLIKSIDQDESYSIYLSVQVIAEGLRHLLKCDNQRCERTSPFTALELFKEMKKVNFTVNNNTHIEFDKNGDPSVGYDIVYWNTSDSQPTQIQTVGQYWPNGRLIFKGDLFGSMKNDVVSVYGCYKKCDNKERRIGERGSCCFKCVACGSTEIFSKNESKCISCASNQYSDDQRVQCLEKTAEYLQWTNALSIILSCAGACGIIITIVFAVLFTIHRDTPIVKAVGGYLCLLELVSLLASFCLTFIFLGKPRSNADCAGLPLFSITFSLCIACILANLLQILVGFNFDVKWMWIKKLNRPIVVVVVVFSIQLTLSVLWLTICPPYPIAHPSETSILYHCEIDSPGFFIAMIVYKGFLGIICFLFAYKGKQLPDLYKNAGLISVSMLLYLVIWIVFVPLYLTFKVKYTPAMECAAVLISSYSILCCHLAPKCYIMVFRKELNDQNAIAEYIRKHFEQKGMAVVRQ